MKTIVMNEKLYQYLLSSCSRESDILKRLRAETHELPEGNMEISPDQGALMAMLAHCTGARRTLDVGVFTGYSSLAVGLALPHDGYILACDVSDEYTQVARRYWREADIAHKIDLRLGPAAQTLQGLLSDDQANSFDLAFIDADKLNYDTYYELALQLVRPGGLILIDNVLWGGAVVDAKNVTPETQVIRALNKKVSEDRRVTACLLPISDGLTLARKNISFAS